MSIISMMVMGDASGASGIKGYDRRRSQLSNAQDNRSIEL